MQKLYKGNDLNFDIKITDSNGSYINIDSVNDFQIKIFTDDSTAAIAGKIVNNIVYFESNSIANLADGIINIMYSYAIDDINFADGKNNSVYVNSTDIYLKKL